MKFSEALKASIFASTFPFTFLLLTLFEEKPLENFCEYHIRIILGLSELVKDNELLVEDTICEFG